VCGFELTQSGALPATGKVFLSFRRCYRTSGALSSILRLGSKFRVESLWRHGVGPV
jgi:hypothetical protein